jgi:hypothetical protein
MRRLAGHPRKGSAATTPEASKRNLVWIFVAGLIVVAAVWPNEAWQWVTTVASVVSLGSLMR